MKRWKMKRVMSMCLTGCMLFSASLSQVAMAKPKSEKTYTVTVDANGGYFSSWNLDEKSLSQDMEVASNSNYEEYHTASDSNADEQSQVASGSNAPKAGSQGPTDDNNQQKETQIKIKVPEGTSIWEAIHSMGYDVQSYNSRSILCGWTTTKNDVMTNVYFGAVGVEKPIEWIDRDITVYALWSQEIDKYTNPEDVDWGYQICTNIVGEDAATVTQRAEIVKPEITKDNLNSWLSQSAWDVENVDYKSAFQINLSGIDEKKGIFINVKGNKRRPVWLFELSPDGRSIVHEVPVILNKHGDDTDAEGTDLAFTAEHSGKYLAVSMDRKVKVLVENVRGGFVVAEYIEYDDGSPVRKVIPIGEEVSLPAGTQLDLRIEQYSDFYLLGLTETDEYEFEDMPVVEPGRLLTKDEDGEQDILTEGEEEFQLEVKKDTVITGEFVFGDSEPVDENLHNLRIGLTNSKYPEPCKVDTEVFVYEGRNKDNRVEVENLEISFYSSYGNHAEFELEGNRLRSNNVLSYGRYQLQFEFDYNGEHCSIHEGTDLWWSLGAGITIGSSTNFGVYLAEGRFKGKDYCIGDSDKGDLIYTSPDTKYSELLQLYGKEMEESVELINYTFNGWYDLEGNTVPADKKVGSGLDLKAKFVNEKGEPYHVVVLPLTDDGDSNDDNENSGGSGGNGSSGGGSGSSGSSSSGGNHSVSGNSPSGAAGVMTGQWQQDNGSWKFLKSNGAYAENEWGQIDGKWYYFGADNKMQINWIFWNNSWYYLDPMEGSMRTGWLQEMETGNWYYLEDSGAMFTGWKQLNGEWYYMNSDSDGTKGRMIIGWYWIPDQKGIQKCYYFNSNLGSTQGKLIRNNVIDGKFVNGNGEWVVNGVVQTK